MNSAVHQSHPALRNNYQSPKTVIAFLTVPILALAIIALAGCDSAEPAKAQAAPKSAPYEQKVAGMDVSFKMLPIPGGKFMMGSPDSEAGHKDDEGPQHEVVVEPFFIEEHEVTWGEYRPFLDNYNRLASGTYVPLPEDKMADAVTYPTPIYEVDAGPKLQRMGREPGAKFPACIMSQFAARQYTKWLSKKTGRFYRLPSEAEWEYACRAGTTTAYSFGDDPKRLTDYAWYNDNSALSDGDVGYHPIKTKKPNPWGLYDMYGNVAEWCMDAYKADWYKQFAGKTTPALETVNWPKEPKTQYPRVIRGGGYATEAADARSAARYHSAPSLNSEDPQIPKSPHWLSDGFFIGFRVVSPMKEPSEAEKLKWWEADDKFTANTIQRDRERRDVPTRDSGAE